MADATKEETKWEEPAETEASFEKIKAFLAGKEVAFEVSEHKSVMTCEEAAEVRNVELKTGAKAMLIKDTGKKLSREGVQYYLAVLSAANRFSSKQFKKTISCKSFRFATPQEVHETTGCLPGAVSPFGSIFNIPTWVDRSLGKNESINFNCGLRTKSITMKYEDYFKAEAPTFNVFTDEEIELGGIPEEPKEEKKVDDREAKKAERLAARQKKVEASTEVKWDPKDPSADSFGERGIIRSGGDPEIRFTKKFTNVGDITKEMKGETVIVRARLHNSRGKGGLAFFVIRHQFSTIQAVLQVGEGISKGMVNYCSKIPKESIIEITAEVTVPENPVEGCTQHSELAVKSFFIIDKAAPILPFQIDDASQICLDQAAEIKQEGDKEEQKEGEQKSSVVMQDVRLNNRIIDLRVPTNHAIFKLQSGVCKLYREFMISRGFTEIHTPKTIGGASEGGANVFKFQYFGQEACLAQSPQLYKQMALMGDFDKVFEIGPVFRAEQSNTNRHLCEFTGLDMEMTIKEHYFEVLDVLGDLLAHICIGLQNEYKKELEVIKK